MFALGRAALAAANVNWDAEGSALTLFALAANREHGLIIVKHPIFRLSARTRPDWLPRIGWRASAYKLLSQRDGGLTFDEILRTITRTANFRFNPGCPAFQLYHNLTDPEGKRLFRQSGVFTIGLVGTRRSAGTATARAGRDSKPAGIARPSGGLHEANIEALLASDLDQIEPGLTLIGRQHSIPPIGRIDLLCRDRKGDLVVIEVKTPDASTDSVIDQIGAYVGWVMEHMATPGQRVRGLIICGRPNQRLAYAVRAYPNLSIKFINLGLQNFDPRSGVASTK